MASRASIDSKLKQLTDLLGVQEERVLAEFQERIDMSWIFHDSALEGTVLSYHELKSAIDKDVVSDVSLIPTYDEIRAHKASIDFVRETASNRKKVPITLDLLRQMHTVVSPEDSEPVEGTWRKETPVHRLYFHDISPPDKIAGEMKKLDEWLKDPETKKTNPALRLASKLHFKIMQIYPYSRHTGKLARLAMNLVLLRSGYPPAIVHSTERQRYYESLKGPSVLLHNLMLDSLENSIDSATKLFSEQKTGRRALA
ncbi:MAG: Fic family protein [Myxococcales bacterium]|nr:Fic family protein [Myxococcales bacterium]